MRRLIVTTLTALAFMASASAASWVNISGKVLSGGKPVAGVPVTDGTQFVTTDRSGKYSMQSAEGTKYVYITLPDGSTPTSCPTPKVASSMTSISRNQTAT